MKDLFISYSINKIKRQYSNYDDDKIAIIKYGLEGLYIMVTKTVIICGIAIILDIWKEMLFLLLFFNLLRMPGFGLHASSSLKCLVSSTTVFIGLSILAKFISLPIVLRLFLSIACILNFILYAPADTEKRPLINKRKRRIYKITTVILSIIYTILTLFINDPFFQNIFIFSMLIESILVNPISYRLLGARYDNYKYYVG